MIRLRATGLLVALVAVAVSGCVSGSSPSKAARPEPDSARASTTAPATGTLAFCVGVFPPLQTRAGEAVVVRFETPGEVLAPSVTVGTQVTVQASPGPFTVVVKGRTLMSGTASAGETQSGSVGTGCAGQQASSG